ncbi:methyltransferase-UbiE family [Coniophora puteana RWD-64-598 SS2]|uniref:Methyltransferase-UbiE family n=1 Tax=Coniophora puteana (strain RWD-64-598) TaxID=741705 RepID=A0A5M3N7E4_CONPW|nr:methyltransferase-UbiE family [Coniophora puteana RWD-64-598 SS2]EIW87087.1 methyltransferase-UbiE family [Coniophora puteana RWD-64-598 SS2]
MSATTNYPHGHGASILRAHGSRTIEDSAAYLASSLRPDMHILDVGCGPGTITADFASRVPQGRVVGVDQASGVLDKARAHAAERGVSNVEFAQADIYNLAYPDASFDVVHAHQVLQYLEDPMRALRELKRVAKPGGIVAVREADYSGFAWYPTIEGLDEWRDLYHKVGRGNGGEPDAGRRVLSWALAAGFPRESITATTSTWCYSTDDTRSWWSGIWQERLLQSEFRTTAISKGHATQEKVEELAKAWKEWSSAEDGWFVLLHGEILCRV